MPHNRIIGIILILCITLIFIPILKTTDTKKQTQSTNFVVFPESKNHNKISEIIIKPAENSGDAIDPDYKQSTEELHKDNIGFIVQIATLKASNIVSKIELQTVLNKYNFAFNISKIKINGTDWIRFYSESFATKQESKQYKTRIDKKLRKYKIKSIIKRDKR